MQVKVKVPTGFRSILAQKTGVIGLVNRVLQRLLLADVLPTNVDVAGIRVHRERRDQAPFDQRVRIVAHDLAVFAGAGFGFVSIHHQIRRPTIAFLGHEGPLQTGGKARTAAPTQAAVFHVLDDPVPPLFDDIGRSIPMTTRLCACQCPVVHTVKVGKDPVLVLQHSCLPFAVAAHPPQLQNIDTRVDQRGQGGKIEQKRIAPRQSQLPPHKLNGDPQDHRAGDHQ